MTEEKGVMEHDLKCQKEYFERTIDGSKGAELRLNDRDYQVGDIINLRELRGTGLADSYSGRSIRLTITHVLPIVAVHHTLTQNYVMLSHKKKSEVKYA